MCLVVRTGACGVQNAVVSGEQTGRSRRLCHILRDPVAEITADERVPQGVIAVNPRLDVPLDRDMFNKVAGKIATAERSARLKAQAGAQVAERAPLEREHDRPARGWATTRCTCDAALREEGQYDLGDGLVVWTPHTNYCRSLLPYATAHMPDQPIWPRPPPRQENPPSSTPQNPSRRTHRPWKKQKRKK
jgi:hypothetical protein